MAKHFADIDIRIVKKYVRVLVRVADHADKIVFHIFVRMASIHEAEVNRRQTPVPIGGEQLVAPHFVVGDNSLHAEFLEMLLYAIFGIPGPTASQRFQWAVL